MRKTTAILGGWLVWAAAASGQVLARPGWAGSGVAPEAWWRRAVIYRIDPARFQDSNGDGQGDAAGIVQRLDYLQSVGVDALLLDGKVDPEGLDDLIREASQHHLRLLLTVTPEEARGPRQTLLNTVHSWLGAGAAGIWVPKAEQDGASDASYGGLLGMLRQVVQGFPGERVMLSDPAPVNLKPAPLRLRGSRRAAEDVTGATRGGQLVTAAIVPVIPGAVAELRASLTAISMANGTEANPLLRFAADPPTGSSDAVAEAAVLLASRGAAIFDFGDEIGLDAYPQATTGTLPTMQWTPSNLTPAAAPTVAAAAPAAAETEFGAYHPYQPPPRSLTGASPVRVRVVPDANIAAAAPDPDTLPGFSAGEVQSGLPDAAKRNVVVEDRDPGSLLNVYRQLIGLHHDNATLRNGSQFVVNRDADDTLVWLRRAPAGSRTVANVVVAANLSDRPVTLALDSDIEALGMRGGALRPLLATPTGTMTGETTAHLVLPPHGVFLGEIFHAGPVEAAPVARGRRSRRHRVRR